MTNASIFLMGIKHCGKTSLGDRLSWEMRMPFIDLDNLIEKEYRPDSILRCREISEQHGHEFFMELEATAARRLTQKIDDEIAVISLGGGTIENQKAMAFLHGNGVFIYLEEEADTLYDRIMRKERPAFLSADNPYEDFLLLYRRRTALYEKNADIIVYLKGKNLEDAYQTLVATLKEQ
jgi:shikimate kinase